MPRPTKEEQGEEKMERAVFYLEPDDVARIEALKDAKKAASYSHMGRLVVLAGLDALEQEVASASAE
jgi:hypothetical protein